MPDINNVPALSTSRNPRGAVRLNGAVVTGWESWDVDNNAFRAADAFSVVFALHGLPAAFGPPWFGVQKEIDCEIFANEAPDDPDNYKPVLADRLIYGQVDDLEYDAVAGTITLRGRDLTARMIDDKVSVGNLNQTSSQIATQIAANHGLTPVVTATKTKIGTVYNQNASSLKQDRSEWDILSELATFEHFDVFVTGTELHFQPKPKDSGDRYAILWQSPTIDFASPIVNATVLHFGRLGDGQKLEREGKKDLFCQLSEVGTSHARWTIGRIFATQISIYRAKSDAGLVPATGDGALPRNHRAHGQNRRGNARR
jgi:hypothetical protein